jgi:uncharacterized Tic20 family protein
MEQIRVIKSSLAVFGFGLASLLPGIGLFLGLVTLALWALTRRRQRDWNPAQRYLDWGARLGLAGIVLTLLVVVSLFLTGSHIGDLFSPLSCATCAR